MSRCFYLAAHHFENFDDWPFLWGQNEGTIAGNTQYVIFGSAFKDRVKGK